jgi:hypothetical protein
MSDRFLVDVEALKLMLVSYATGGHPDNSEYVSLRKKLHDRTRVWNKLPRCVHVCRDLSEFWSFIKGKFGTYAERRDYLRTEFDPILTILETETRTPSDSSISETIGKVDSGYILETWQKALDRRATDAEGAITAARTLLESVCKHILDEFGVSYNDTADLPSLCSLAAKQLKLSPSQHTELVFKQILGGCQTVVEGLGALRNRHSDAHGKGARAVRPSPRHAALAVNLSGTVATFLLETFEARKTFP